MNMSMICRRRLYFLQMIFRFGFRDSFIPSNRYMIKRDSCTTLLCFHSSKASPADQGMNYALFRIEASLRN